ncbi:MAG: hypothetical protein KA035_00910 [Candidatus Levybacteria bacterium]|nr:hypothetical protein [Candidatus Levybacteria bacterium]
MTLIITITVIFILSFIWALFSLRGEIIKPKALKKIKEELAREKILFKR